MSRPVMLSLSACHLRGKFREPLVLSRGLTLMGALTVKAEHTLGFEEFILAGFGKDETIFDD
jgi:hypothetical protein